ncbi:MAG: hypothetical protein PWP43_629 [Bacillota bacterium]|jgi:sugar diacid utilization regulator|nr:hypothetical protein [Bacillota bacterium]
MLTVKDCLQLGILRFAEIWAGSAGLNRAVDAVTVAEFTEAPSELLRGNELIISALYSIRDDVDKQLAFIDKLNQAKAAGLVLFYLGIYLKDLSPEVLRRADELGFPLIVMPKNRIDFSYVDVITPVTDAILQEKAETVQLSAFTKMLQLSNEERNLRTFLRHLAEELGCGLILTDSQLNPISWSLDDQNLQLDVYEVCSWYRQSMAHNPQSTLATQNPYGCQIIPIHTSAKDAGFLVFASPSSDHKIPLALKQQAAMATAVVVRLVQVMTQNSLEQECAALLLSGNVARALSLTDQGQLNHGVNIHKIDAVALIQVYNPVLGHEIPTVADKVGVVKKQIEAQNIRGLVTAEGNTVVLLLETSALKNREKRMSDLGSRVRAYFAKEFGCKVKIGIADRVDDLCSIKPAYERLKISLMAASLVYPYKQFYGPRDMELPYTLFNVLPSMTEFIDRHLGLLQEYDRKNRTEYLTTLATFLVDCQCSLSDAAENLYIHPNTLKYRIQVIRKILGYDVLAWPARAELFLALALDRLRRRKNAVDAPLKEV